MEQYNINLFEEEKKDFNDKTALEGEVFYSLLSTLRSDTSLGNIVSIRSASKEERKHFNSNQLRIYNDWKNRRTRIRNELTKEEMIERQRPVQMAFRGLFEAQQKNKK